MPGLDDFTFRRTSSPGMGEPPRPRWWPWALAAAVIAILSFVVWQTWRARPAAPDSAEIEAEEPAPPSPQLSAPADQVTLPQLAESDPFVRQLVAGLSAHPRFASWLVPNNLIDRFVAVVDNIADGHRPASHLRILAPTEPFRVIQKGSSVVIDPRSYERYGVIADVVSSVDAQGAAKLYTMLKPLVDEAYRQLGYPDRQFDDTVSRALQHLLDTPIPDADVSVVQDEVIYLYADPELEARSAIEKQLMRMGPRNVRMIQDKLREVVRALGLD